MHTISFVHCGPLSSDSRVNTRAQAVQYFQRALRLDRAYLSAWTLMGHEFVELKNPARRHRCAAPCTSFT